MSRPHVASCFDAPHHRPIGYPWSPVSNPHERTNLIADLQQKRRDMEEVLDTSARSRVETDQIIAKIIDLKHRSEGLRQAQARVANDQAKNTPTE